MLASAARAGLMVTPDSPIWFAVRTDHRYLEMQRLQLEPYSRLWLVAVQKGDDSPIREQSSLSQSALLDP